MARLSDYAKKVYPTQVAGVYVKNCTFDELEKHAEEFKKLNEDENTDGIDRVLFGFKWFLRDEKGEKYEDCLDKTSLTANHGPIFIREVDEAIAGILGGGDPKKD